MNLKEGNTDYWNPLEKIWNNWQPKNPNKKTEIQLEDIRDQVEDDIADLAKTIFTQNQDTKLDSWIMGAEILFQSLIIGMLEGAEFDKNIKLETFNLPNIAFANQQNDDPEQLINYFKKLKDKLWIEKNQICRALRKGGSYINAPLKEASGYRNGVTATLNAYTTYKIKKIIRGKTNILLDITKPQAIFIIIDHEKKINFNFVSLFVNEIYKNFNNILKLRNTKKLEREVYFLLDEFNNFPKLSELDSMVSIGAGLNIFFMFAVQDYGKIAEKYGQASLNFLLANTGYKYYFMSGEEDTRESISRQMCEEEISNASISFQSNNRNNHSESYTNTKKRLMSSSDLARLPKGEAILLSLRNHPLKTTFAKYWEFEGWNHEIFENDDNEEKKTKNIDDPRPRDYIFTSYEDF